MKTRPQRDREGSRLALVDSHSHICTRRILLYHHPEVPGAQPSSGRSCVSITRW
jgi:hypothetical protein